MLVEVADMIRASQPDQAAVRLVYGSEGGKVIGKEPSDACEVSWHGSYEPGKPARGRK